MPRGAPLLAAASQSRYEQAIDASKSEQSCSRALDCFHSSRVETRSSTKLEGIISDAESSSVSHLPIFTACSLATYHVTCFAMRGSHANMIFRVTYQASIFAAFTFQHFVFLLVFEITV